MDFRVTINRYGDLITDQYLTLNYLTDEERAAIAYIKEEKAHLIELLIEKGDIEEFESRFHYAAKECACAITYAIKHKQFAILRRLHAMGCPWDDEAVLMIYISFDYDRFQMLKWLRNQHRPPRLPGPWNEEKRNLFAHLARETRNYCLTMWLHEVEKKCLRKSLLKWAHEVAKVVDIYFPKDLFGIISTFL